MKRLRIIYLISAWVIELVAMQRWLSCFLFKENFYFTVQNLTTHLTNDINADTGMPIFLVRVIHNKVLALGWGLSQSLLQYWDIRFLEEFIGIVGAFGLGLSIWYFVTKDRKNKILWVLFALGIFLPLIDAFFQPQGAYRYFVVTFGVIFQILSLYGFWRFLESKSTIRYIVVTILFIISVLFLFTFTLSYQNFCIKM